jgi:hypothetical protein
VYAIVEMLRDHAAQHEERGSIDGFDRKCAADFLDLDEARVEAVVIALTTLRWIAANRIVRFAREQPSDYSTPRVRAYRARRPQPAKRETIETVETPESESDAESDQRENSDSEGKPDLRREAPRRCAPSAELRQKKRDLLSRAQMRYLAARGRPGAVEPMSKRSSPAGQSLSCSAGGGDPRHPHDR